MRSLSDYWKPTDRNDVYDGKGRDRYIYHELVIRRRLATYVGYTIYKKANLHGWNYWVGEWDETENGKVRYVSAEGAP